MVVRIEDHQMNTLFQSIRARELLRANLSGPAELAITQVDMDVLEEALHTAELYNEAEANWQLEGEGLQKEIDKLNNKLDTANETLKDLQETHDEVLDEKICLQSNVEALEETVKGLESDVDGKNREIAQLRADLAKAHERLQGGA